MEFARKISIIVAMAKNRVIGIDNQLPWHLSADLKRFKALTLGNPIIMGRKTHESIGKPLPGRQNIIVTRNQDYKTEGCDIAHDLAAAIDMAEPDKEIFIIGGAQIYQQALSSVNYLYLTLVDIECQGDAHFPEWEHKEWQERAREDHPADDRNDYAYSFVDLERT